MQRIDDPDPARANRQALDDIAQGATGLVAGLRRRAERLRLRPAGQARSAGDRARTASRSTASTSAHRRASGEPRQRRLAGRAARQAARRSGQAQPLLRHRPGGGLRRHRPAAHVDRGAAGVDAAIAGAFLRARRARRPARGRRPRLPQCRRHRGAGTRHHARLRGLASAACSRRRARRWSMPRRISALRSASTRTSSCRWPRSGRCACCGRACRRPARSRRRPATIHAETSYRMMTAKDPETNILRTTIAGFAAAAGGADSISILPHTIAHGLPDAFARRIARNTQLILAERKPYRFRRRSRRRLRQRRGADRRALRSGLGRVPGDRSGRRHPATAWPPARSRRASSTPATSAPSDYRNGKRADRRHDALSADDRACRSTTLAAEPPADRRRRRGLLRAPASRCASTRRSGCRNDPRFRRHRLAKPDASAGAARQAEPGRRRKASRSSASTASATSPACPISTPGRASRPSSAAPTRPCMSSSPGRSANMPASRRPRNPTPSTGAISPPARKACRSPSTSPPIAAMTATIRASPAMSAWPAWRSIPSSTCASCSTASRSAR